MMSRLFHADGTPRDPALWLVLAGMAASLLLALFAVCVHQVERAEVRHAQERAQATQLSSPQVASQADAGSVPMGSRIR